MIGIEERVNLAYAEVGIGSGDPDECQVGRCPLQPTYFYRAFVGAEVLGVCLFHGEKIAYNRGVEAKLGVCFGEGS